ncbi:sugar ABC transporter permease [candidate division TA06 bacterium DG_78]|uniref:Sugar ABC transporter permease n=1 Tax=candidate division TA06 bacterium DG_78 TaxID=1703772 RepID=A0A0S7YHG2_UNCT6|nr:MAG: sugar ABC transporter permease [candidate division TA06 bacterium DG_78]
MKEDTGKKILFALGVLFILVFCLVPFIWMLIISFNERADFIVNIGSQLTTKNYIDILRLDNLHFLDYLRNSIIIAGAAALLSGFIGALAAYAVSRISFPGKILLVFAVLSMSMFPQISIVGYLYKFMAALGWINTYQALILPYVSWSLPLALWIMMSYFSQIPYELDKAAQIDGASKLQTLTKIIFPITLPGFLSTILLLLMFAFNEFLFALMLTIDYRTRTVPVGIALFQGLHGELPWGYIMAAAVISCIPVIAIALVFQKHIIQGLTRGAVKQ